MASGGHKIVICFGYLGDFLEILLLLLCGGLSVHMSLTWITAESFHLQECHSHEWTTSTFPQTQTHIHIRTFFYIEGTQSPTNLDDDKNKSTHYEKNMWGFAIFMISIKIKFPLLDDESCMWVFLNNNTYAGRGELTYIFTHIYYYFTWIQISKTILGVSFNLCCKYPFFN